MELVDIGPFEISFSFAMDFLLEGDPEAALAALSSQDPKTAEVWEGMAQAHMALLDPEEAQTCLQKAIQMAPDAGHAKYLLMAQILAGKDSLACLERAWQLLPESVEPRVASSCLTAMAELYLTGKLPALFSNSQICATRPTPRTCAWGSLNGRCRLRKATPKYIPPWHPTTSRLSTLKRRARTRIVPTTSAEVQSSRVCRRMEV